MPVFEIQRRRNPEATRTAILDAAEKLFVARGFAATSMSEISQEGGVTKSLIHHHFGSKEELWDEVKKRRLALFSEPQEEALGQEEGGQEELARSIERYFRFLQENPEFVRLQAWMTLEDPKLSALVRPDLIEAGVDRFRQEQEDGRVRADVQPWHMMFCFLALTTHWFMTQHAYGRSESAGPSGHSSDEEYLEDMLKIFLQGIAPPGDEGPESPG